jgi:hypothetical protein
MIVARWHEYSQQPGVTEYAARKAVHPYVTSHSSGAPRRLATPIARRTNSRATSGNEYRKNEHHGKRCARQHGDATLGKALKLIPWVRSAFRDFGHENGRCSLYRFAIRPTPLRRAVDEATTAQSANGVWRRADTPVPAAVQGDGA